MKIIRHQDIEGGKSYCSKIRDNRKLIAPEVGSTEPKVNYPDGPPSPVTW